MRRVVVRCVVLAVGSSLAACLPNFQGPVVSAISSPTPITEPSGIPLATASLPGSPTATRPGHTFTPIPTFTATAGVPTGTTSALTASSPTAQAATPSMQAGAVSIDKLPAGTIFQRVRIRNTTRSGMDISLYCTTVQGLNTLMQYSNAKDLVVEAPLGSCVYTLFVRGRQMSGLFSVTDQAAVTLTVYPDRVAIH